MQNNNPISFDFDELWPVALARESTMVPTGETATLSGSLDLVLDAPRLKLSTLVFTSMGDDARLLFVGLSVGQDLKWSAGHHRWEGYHDAGIDVSRGLRWRLPRAMQPEVYVSQTISIELLNCSAAPIIPRAVAWLSPVEEKRVL